MAPKSASTVLEIRSSRDNVAGWVEQAVQSHLHQRQLELLEWFVYHPDTPEDLLLQFCDQGLFLVQLAHRSGPRKLLERLANEHHIDEAALTVAKDLYTNPGESASVFRDFLGRHKDNVWMLNSLALLEASAAEKEHAYLEVLKHHTDLFDRFIGIRNSRQQARQAKEASDPQDIARLYATEDPEVLSALAANPHTSQELLTALSLRKSGKRARVIRNLARETLKQREKNLGNGG